MPFNLFFESRQSPQPRPAPSFVEPLERRVLMHEGPLQVNGVVADNRGEMIITLNQAIRPSNVNTGAVQMYTPGPDGILGNQDDHRVATMLNYQPLGNRIIIRAHNLPADTGYRIKLVSARMETPDSDVGLDGLFTGTFPSGTGLQNPGGTHGGNFEFQVKHDLSTRPVTRWSTSEGVINVTHFRDITPLHYNNFRTYADAGDYDNTFFTRSVPGFIIQGGSLKITPENDVIEGPVRPAIQNEFNVSNVRGTIAMAKQGGNPDSATNQWFFNLADNGGEPPNGLDFQNGGFTVFGEIRQVSGFAVIDAIAAKERQDLSAQIGTTAATDTSTVPVNAQVTGELDPMQDLVTIRRIAQLMRVVPL